MVKIFIADSLPGLNKGEIAILEGMLESFNILDDEVEVAVLSHHPQTDAPRYPTRAKTVDVTRALPLYSESRNGKRVFRMFWSISFALQHLIFLILHRIFGSKALKFMSAEIWKAYVESDVIIEGHDGSFAIGGGKTGLPLYFYLLYLPFFAKMLKKKVVLYGGSINKPKRSRSLIGKIFRLVLNRIDLVTLRESFSHQYLKEIGVQDSKTFITTDLSFLLPPAPFTRVQEIMKREGIERVQRPYIGITATRQIASGAFSDTGATENNYRKHTEMLAQVIDEVTGKFDATVIFIPHCIGFGEELDDRRVARDIFSKCKNKDRVKLITNEYDAEELKGLIGQFDLLIGERMHSVISAMSMCVPAVALIPSTDQRSDIIRTMGQEGTICHTDNLTAQALISKVSDIWLKRSDIRKELKSQNEIMEDQAMISGKLLKGLLNTAEGR